MARSNYVYIVMPYGCYTPERAFTVKWALNEYLERRWARGGQPPCTVYRLTHDQPYATVCFSNPKSI